MSGPGTDRQTEDKLFEEAAEWFARMRGPDARASRARFEAWLALGEEQRSAYNRAAEIFAMGKLLDEDRGRPDSGEPGPAKRRLPAMASLGVLALVLAATLLVFRDGWNRSQDSPGTDAGHGVETAVLAAQAGENRIVRLSDHSIVSLGGGTRVEARFTAGRRSLSLDRGEARFEVAHEGRPFIVLAGGGSVTALGTIFEVALAPDRRVSVRLLKGSVDVRLPPSGRRAAVRRLRPGESVSFAAIEPAGRTQPGPEGRAGLETATGTPAVEALDFHSIPLADLVAAANRGSPVPIRLVGARAGERRVSGRFRIDDTGLLAERLALLFNLAIDRTDPAEIVLRSR